MIKTFFKVDLLGHLNWFCINGAKVSLSMQDSGWALNSTSQVVRMMDQWEEWGTLPAHQNMAFLLLRHVFRGESLWGSLYFYLKVMVIFSPVASQRQIERDRLAKQMSLINSKCSEEIFEFENKLWKRWGCISWPLSIHLLALMSAFDSIICVYVVDSIPWGRTVLLSTCD